MFCGLSTPKYSDSVLNPIITKELWQEKRCWNDFEFFDMDYVLPMGYNLLYSKDKAKWYIHIRGKFESSFQILISMRGGVRNG